MFNHADEMEIPVNSECEKSRVGESIHKSRRSSILKPPKVRAPLLDVNFITKNENEDFEAARKRRVSFAGVNKVREFNSKAGANHVSNTPSYDELFSSSSESSGMSMSESCGTSLHATLTEEQASKVIIDMITHDDTTLLSESMDITDMDLTSNTIDDKENCVSGDQLVNAVQPEKFDIFSEGKTPEKCGNTSISVSNIAQRSTHSVNLQPQANVIQVFNDSHIVSKPFNLSANRGDLTVCTETTNRSLPNETMDLTQAVRPNRMSEPLLHDIPFLQQIQMSSNVPKPTEQANAPSPFTDMLLGRPATNNAQIMAGDSLSVQIINKQSFSEENRPQRFSNVRKQSFLNNPDVTSGTDMDFTEGIPRANGFLQNIISSVPGNLTHTNKGSGNVLDESDSMDMTQLEDPIQSDSNYSKILTDTPNKHMGFTEVFKPNALPDNQERSTSMEFTDLLVVKPKVPNNEYHTHKTINDSSNMEFTEALGFRKVVNHENYLLKSNLNVELSSNMELTLADGLKSKRRSVTTKMELSALLPNRSGCTTSNMDLSEAKGLQQQPNRSTSNMDLTEARGILQPNRSTSNMDLTEARGILQPNRSTSNMDLTEARGILQPNRSGCATSNMDLTEARGILQPNRSGCATSNMDLTEARGILQPNRSTSNMDLTEARGILQPNRSGCATSNMDLTEARGLPQQPNRSTSNMDLTEARGLLQPNRSGCATSNMDLTEARGLPQQPNRSGCSSSNMDLTEARGLQSNRRSGFLSSKKIPEFNNLFDNHKNLNDSSNMEFTEAVRSKPTENEVINVFNNHQNLNDSSNMEFTEAVRFKAAGNEVNYFFNNHQNLDDSSNMEFTEAVRLKPTENEVINVFNNHQNLNDSSNMEFTEAVRLVAPIVAAKELIDNRQNLNNSINMELTEAVVLKPKCDEAADLFDDLRMHLKSNDMELTGVYVMAGSRVNQISASNMEFTNVVNVNALERVSEKVMPIIQDEPPLNESKVTATGPIGDTGELLCSEMDLTQAIIVGAEAIGRKSRSSIYGDVACLPTEEPKGSPCVIDSPPKDAVDENKRVVEILPSQSIGAGVVNEFEKPDLVPEVIAPSDSFLVNTSAEDMDITASLSRVDENLPQPIPQSVCDIPNEQHEVSKQLDVCAEDNDNMPVKKNEPIEKPFIEVINTSTNMDITISYPISERSRIVEREELLVDDLPESPGLNEVSMQNRNNSPPPDDNNLDFTEVVDNNSPENICNDMELPDRSLSAELQDDDGKSCIGTLTKSTPDGKISNTTFCIKTTSISIDSAAALIESLRGENVVGSELERKSNEQEHLELPQVAPRDSDIVDKVVQLCLPGVTSATVSPCKTKKGNERMKTLGKESTEENAIDVCENDMVKKENTSCEQLENIENLNLTTADFKSERRQPIDEKHSDAKRQSYRSADTKNNENSSRLSVPELKIGCEKLAATNDVQSKQQTSPVNTLLDNTQDDLVMDGVSSVSVQNYTTSMDAKERHEVRSLLMTSFPDRRIGSYLGFDHHMQDYKNNVENLKFMKSLGFSRVSFTEWSYKLTEMLSILIELPTGKISEATLLKSLSYDINKRADVVQSYIAERVIDHTSEDWLKSRCITVKDVLPIFKAISETSLRFENYFRPINYLHRFYPFKLNESCLSFYIVNVEARLKFDVKISFNGFKKIKSNDIHIKNRIGFVREKFVRCLFDSVEDNDFKLFTFVRYLEDYCESLVNKT